MSKRSAVSAGKITRVASYLRVSTTGQAKQDTSIPAQRRAIHEYAKRQGWSVVSEYVDEGESATTDARRQFQMMLTDANQKNRAFDAIIVYDFSRFARDRVDSAVLKRMLRKIGIKVVSATQPIEDTAEGRLLEGVVEMVDQYHSDRMRVTISRGQREIVGRGFWRGGNVPFGYRAASRADGANFRAVLEIDPTVSPIVERLFRRIAEGESIRDSTFWLRDQNVNPRRSRNWNIATVWNMLHNNVYRGVVVLKSSPTGGAEFRAESSVPAIIAPDLWDRAHAKMREAKPRRGPDRYVYLLNGIGRCSKCHTRIAVMSTGPSNGNFRYYVCRSKLEKNGCSEPNVRVDVLEKSFFAHHILNTKFLDDDMSVAAAYDFQLKRQRSEVDKLESQERNLIAALADGALLSESPIRTSIRDQIADLNGRLAVARTRFANMVSSNAETDRQYGELRRAAEMLRTTTDRETLKRYVRANFSEITVNLAAKKVEFLFVTGVSGDVIAEALSIYNSGKDVVQVYRARYDETISGDAIENGAVIERVR